MRTRGIVSILDNNQGEPGQLVVPVWHSPEEGSHEAGHRFAGSLLCEAHKSRLGRARSAGLAALNLMLALPVI